MLLKKIGLRNQYGQQPRIDSQMFSLRIIIAAVHISPKETELFKTISGGFRPDFSDAVYYISNDLFNV
jgi:hypothetical protein